MKTCTCPHQYTAIGLQRYGTDATCFVHGAPKAPVIPPTVEREVPLAPRSPMVDCEACGFSHPGGQMCPDL